MIACVHFFVALLFVASLFMAGFPLFCLRQK